MNVERPPVYELFNKEAFLLTNSNAVKKANAEYVYWSKAKYQARAANLNENDFWTALKYKRQASAQNIKIYETFYFNVPPDLQRAFHKFDMHFGGTLGTDLPPGSALREKTIVSSLITEAFSSSKLEGAVSTRERAKEMIRTDKMPRNKNERMIYNNYLAMEFIRQHRDSPLSLELLFELHQILVYDTLDDTGKAGRFRNDEELVDVVDMTSGDIIYTPPHASQLNDRMKELILFFNYQENRNKTIFDGYIHPVLRSTVVHFLIGYIHPFYDGNGRMARALFYWHMMKNGYWMTEFLSISQVILESRTQYYSAYLHTEYDELDVTYFLQYHCRALLIAFDKLQVYLKRKLANEHVWFGEQAKDFNITARQAQLLSAMRNKPTPWTVPQAEGFLNIGKQAARLDLKQLVQKKLAKELTVDGRTKAYLA